MNYDEMTWASFVYFFFLSLIISNEAIINNVIECRRIDRHANTFDSLFYITIFEDEIQSIVFILKMNTKYSTDVDQYRYKLDSVKSMWLWSNVVTQRNRINRC